MSPILWYILPFCLNNPFEIISKSTVIMKTKERECELFNSFILCNHLEFSTVFYLCPLSEMERTVLRNFFLGGGISSNLGPYIK